MREHNSELDWLRCPKMVRWLFVGLISIALSGVTPAQASSWSDCLAGSDMNLRIDACTAIIEGGRESKEWKAQAYLSRGRSYLQRGSADLAIEDLSKAIQLKPDFALAYYHRGKAFDFKSTTSWRFRTLVKLRPSSRIL